MQLTYGQREVVRTLYNDPTLRLTASELAHFRNISYYPSNEWSPDRMRSVLNRLEKRGIVRRFGKPFRWQLTPEARQAYGRGRDIND